MMRLMSAGMMAVAVRISVTCRWNMGMSALMKMRSGKMEKSKK